MVGLMEEWGGLGKGEMIGGGGHTFSQRGVWMSGHPIADFGHLDIHIFGCMMQWDEKELDTQFTPIV